MGPGVAEGRLHSRRREGCIAWGVLAAALRQPVVADIQVRELTDYCQRQGWDLTHTYTDVISGAKVKRPGLDQLMADARLRQFDCVLVWKLDRFGRSLVDCLNNIQALEPCGIRILVVTQGLGTDHRNPASRFLLQILGAAAEFERSLIVESSQVGQAKYRQAYEAGKVGIGKAIQSHSGKNQPPHRPKKVFDRQRVLELRRKGVSMRGIARRIGIGLGTVSRTLDERSGSQLEPGDRGDEERCATDLPSRQLAGNLNWLTVERLGEREGDQVPVDQPWPIGAEWAPEGHGCRCQLSGVKGGSRLEH